MSEQVLQAEVVVSSWPFRTGVIVYDPVLGRDIAEWRLGQLVHEPGVLPRLRHLLDPRLPYRRRAEAIVADLNTDQRYLQEMYGLDETVTVQARVSDEFEEGLGRFAEEHGVSLELLWLDKLYELLETLAGWEPERHHRFCVDLYELFHRPPGGEGPTEFARRSAPGGAMYTAEAPNKEWALRLWEKDVNCPVGDFNLWRALRAHWGWRLEFAEHDPPVFSALEELERMFSDDN